jgi:selenocysteine lyase/cysteine desulfurase
LIERLDVPKLAPAPEESPERLETGTQNHEGIVGAGAAVDWLASLVGKEEGGRREEEGGRREEEGGRREEEGGRREAASDRRVALGSVLAELHKRGAMLFAQLWNGLGDITGVQRFGLPPDGRRTPTLSFRVKGVSSDDVAVALAQRGLFVSHGDFYAATIIERLGGWPDGVVRVGCSAYSTESEIARVVESMERVSQHA